MEKNDRDGGVSASQSPRFFRRKIAVQVPMESKNMEQGKVVLGEVEEKLKSMRQKRLDRLSTFVADQTKLSNERAAKNEDGNEIENAIMSMKQSPKKERKILFKSIDEENLIQNTQVTSEEILLKENPKTPKLFRKFSNESMDKSSDKSKQMQKSSSTRKFINKFNCATNQSPGNSIEDLTNENEYKKTNSLPNCEELNKPLSVSRSSLQESVIMTSENTVSVVENTSENYNPLLTPVGKQRKGIYLYDTECKFLEHEKPPILSTFKKIEKHSEGVVTKNNEPPASPYGDDFISKPMKSNSVQMFSSRLPLQEEKLEKSGDTNILIQKKDTNIIISNKNVVLESKGDNISEKKPIIAIREDKPKLHTKTSKRNSVSDILDDKNSNIINNLNRLSANDSLYSDNKISNVTFQNNLRMFETQVTYENISLNKTEKRIVPNIVNSNIIQNNRKSEENIFVTPKSPKPLPRASPMPVAKSINKEEKTLKKFQRNLDSLNEILKNDSDVDGDEIEDLKKTYDDTNTLLADYGMKLKILQGKARNRDNYLQKLNEISGGLKQTKEDISHFKGLKRDSIYKELNDRLSNWLSDINKINVKNSHLIKKKTVILTEAENCLKNLENKVHRNENMLLELLEAQVDSISTNIFNITKV